MAVYSLPKTFASGEKLDPIIERYKAFRLLSLKQSPESFSSSYEREIAFPDETWIKRVSGPLSTNIVAVAGRPPESEGNKDQERDLLLKEEWLASLTLQGPFDKEAAVTMFKSHMWIESPSIIMDDDIEFYFGLYGMYVAPTARGAGLGVSLVEYAKKKAWEMVGGKKTRVVLVVDFDNIGARRTYEKAQFVLNHDYWFDDTRCGRSERTQSAVLRVDIGGTDNLRKDTTS
ncbi:unnamed protein product [Clonostachys chloroleuca]|uniref:N-acetyltransferase domain-containing protein n=1 Tax=Clonostachys chloroleuca TaxID=1926264 RepID=A0AA35Q7I2_9HYPO|nr:unnamed protein product [Clonostachys chloroleuca]